MDGLMERCIAAVLIACFFVAASGKLVAALQQCGYGSRRFLKWYFKSENAFHSRFAYWAFLSAFATYGLALSFSFLKGSLPLVVSSIPFFFFAILFFIADKSYAFKVPCVRSGRLKRLTAAYFAFTALVAFVVISLCSFLGGLLAAKNLPEWVVLGRYIPVSFLPLLLPWTLCLTNLVEGIFEKLRNARYIKRAGQVLDESKIMKIGVVGSYGKTTVKTLLAGLLSVKYSVLASPLSYNTPIGVAKTVDLFKAQGAEVLVMEFGARKLGDIEELCELVKPQTVVFTGVCAQHLETFGGEETVLKAKCECLGSVASTAVCGEGLRERIENADFLSESEKEKCVYADLQTLVKDVVYFAEKTCFTLCLDGEEIAVEVPLLGRAAVENIALAAKAASVLGLTGEEIEKGLRQVKPIPHRLELKKEKGVFILDDAYNANEKGAAKAIEALCRFEGKKYLVTPGIIETGVMSKKINENLGALIANANLDGVALVGGAQVKAVKDGYLNAGGDETKLSLSSTLEKAVGCVSSLLKEGDAILFLNDLPDAY